MCTVTTLPAAIIASFGSCCESQRKVAKAHTPHTPPRTHRPFTIIPLWCDASLQVGDSVSSIQRSSDAWKLTPRHSQHRNVDPSVAEARKRESEALALPLKARIAQMQADSEKWKTEKRHSQLLTKTDSGDVVKDPTAVAGATAVDFKRTAAGHTVRKTVPPAAARITAEHDPVPVSSDDATVGAPSHAVTTASTSRKVGNASSGDQPAPLSTTKDDGYASAFPTMSSTRSGIDGAGNEGSGAVVESDEGMYADLSFSSERQYPVPEHDDVTYVRLAVEQPQEPSPQASGSALQGDGGDGDDDNDDGGGDEDDDDDDDEYTDDPSLLYDNAEHGRNKKKLPLPRLKKTVSP
jgi:hypothetical protein